MPFDALLATIRDHVAQLGFELADVRRTGTLQRPILQVRVDRPDSRPGHGITAEECARVSRSLERALESARLVGPRYVLEVSSPGLERPLRFPEHWRRFIGQPAKVKSPALPGRPVVTIAGVPDDDTVVLRLEDGREVTVALDTISDAHLVVTWPRPGKP